MVVTGRRRMRRRRRRRRRRWVLRGEGPPVTACISYNKIIRM